MNQCTDDMLWCDVLCLCLTAEQAVQRTQSLTERFHMLGGAEPAGDGICEETVIFTHRLQEEEEDEEGEEETSVVMETCYRSKPSAEL